MVPTVVPPTTNLVEQAQPEVQHARQRVGRVRPDVLLALDDHVTVKSLRLRWGKKEEKRGSNRVVRRVTSSCQIDTVSVMSMY